MMTASTSDTSVSLGRLFASHRWRILLTWGLVLLEAAAMLMFPLVMGIAIDGMLQQRYFGLCLLGGLGAVAVLVGALRRFYDTRVYSKIYARVAEQIVAQEHHRQTEVSAIAARTNMATEFVEFLENSLPEIINAVIGLVGALLMIYFLQFDSFFACLAATVVIVIIYAATSGRTLRLNQGANDESERSVDVIGRNDRQEVSSHFRQVMRWNIRLSDLETATFSLSWIVMIAVVLYSIWATVDSGITAQGKVLAIVMYVFSYIESVIVMPLFYQQAVRLREIAVRLKG